MALIPEAEIERVKTANPLMVYLRARGLKLLRRGKQYVGLCPFHNDHEPSFIVDSNKQLWNCLGACQQGGDIYRFVMRAEGIDFRAAHERLAGSNGKAASKPPRNKEPNIADLEWLTLTAEHYHQRLLATPAAQDYLRRRGITDPTIIQTFKLGYADGTLIEKLSTAGQAALKRLGVLTEAGRELMAGCIIFPLVQAESGQIISLYGRHTEKRQHLYLPGERRGLFNPQGAQNTDEVIITESVIDAAALWSAGVRNVIPIYGINGLTAEIVLNLQECRTRRAVLMLDADEAGQQAAARITAQLAEKNIAARAIELPAKDASEFISNGGKYLKGQQCHNH